MRLRQLSIKGFKSIVDETIELGRVNCFIGANGVGKSNLLEALGVIGAAAGGRVDDEAMIRRGVRAGLPRLFKTSFIGTQIRPHIFLEGVGDPEATYRVSLLNPLEKPEPAWSFKSEILSSGKEPPFVQRAPRGKSKLNLPETAGLAALSLVQLAPDDPKSCLLKLLQDYAIYSPNTPALRATVPDPQTRRPVGLVGGGLAEGFEALKHGLDDEVMDEVLDLVDWVSEVGATNSAGPLMSPSVPRVKQVLRFTDRFMAKSRNTLTAHDASEGALYVLFTAILCLSASAPGLLAIDNIDSALNPRLATSLVSKLNKWLQTANPDRQLLFTAHNPAVLDGLDLDDEEVRLFAVERNSDGHTKIRRIEISDELSGLSKEYPLSRLWSMGNLGAVPNV